MTFLGAPALAAVALFQARRSGSLNDDLKEAGDPARIENLTAARDDFVTPWVA